MVQQSDQPVAQIVTQQTVTQVSTEKTGQNRPQPDANEQAVLALLWQVSARINALYEQAGLESNSGPDTAASAQSTAQWHASIEVETKEDNSPLTLADRIANQMLIAGLQAIYPGQLIYSEEQLPDSRPEGQSFWLLDPLDGTREFIRRTGEFTINLAWIVDGRPVSGYIAVPQQQLVMAALQGQLWQAGQGGDWQPVTAAERPTGIPASWRISYSRSGQQAGAYEDLLATLTRHQVPYTVQRYGSACKFIRMVQGQVDWYPRLHPTMEWDTAAGQAILEAAGGCLVDLQGQPFRYGVRDRWQNGPFMALADASYLPQVQAWLAARPERTEDQE